MEEKFKGVFIDAEEGTAKAQEFTEKEIETNLQGRFQPFIIPAKVRGVADPICIFSICDISEQFKEEAKYSIPSVVYRENNELKPLAFKNVFILADHNGFRSFSDQEIQKVMEQMTIYNSQICLLVSELL